MIRKTATFVIKGKPGVVEIQENPWPKHTLKE
jgi:hypothetical protein